MSYTHSTISGVKRGGKVHLEFTATEIAKINEMGTELESVEAGSVGDGTITNAKLATDVKAGSLAALTTTEKGSLQGAINEVDANADTAQSAVDTLEAIVGNTSLTTAAQTVTGAINELDAANTGMATITGTQTLTNKTMTSPILNTPKIGDGDAGCTFTSAEQTNASATATIPDIGDAADTFVMADTTQTLTNKTHTSPKIGTAICDTGGNEIIKTPATSSAVNEITVTNAAAGNAPKISATGNDTNIDLHLTGKNTGNVKVSDGTDETKLAVFELNGATTGKTTTFAISHTDDRTITFPDATVTLASVTGTETLTNKTLKLPVIADSTDATKDIHFTLSGATTGKGLTLISAHTDDRSITVPDATGTIALENRNPTLTIGAHDYDGGSADWTLSAAELLLRVHKPTNANAPVNAIVSTAIKEYRFINATGQTLTVKTAAGTGIQISDGNMTTLFCDGTNVIEDN